LVENEGLVDGECFVDATFSWLPSLNDLFFFISIKFNGGLKHLILPPNRSWPDCLWPPKPPPK
jgi:hypothetical protein